MKKGLLLVVYVVIAAAVIGFGTWYAGKLNNPPASTATNTNPSTPQPTAPGQTVTTMDGLIIKEDTIGTGTVAAVGDYVTVNYTGTLDDGTVFDSSLKPGRTPFSFLLGAGQVIKGWDEGVAGMKIGGTRELTIPPALGYGAQGAGTVIPPNATLHFTVSLLSVSTSTPSAQ
jgi:FKBP-type peptidyl-prolyl cis-trans isomerase FkpA